jgi:hypothetical protein
VGFWSYRRQSDLADEAVTAAGQSLDQAGFVGGVPQDLPQAVHCGIQAVVKVHKGVGRPQNLPQLLAGDQSPGTFQQHFKNLEGLPWQTKPHSVLAELLRLQIRIERAEADHCGNALAIFRHAAE